MTEREQALLQEAVNWIRSRYPANSILPDHAQILLDQLAAALSDHAVPQVSLTRKGASGTVDVDSRKVEPATSPFSTPAGAAPASVSPQAPTALNLSCPFGEGVGQGGTAAGADWKPTVAELEWLVNAPEGIFIVEMQSTGEVRAVLGERGKRLFLSAAPAFQARHDVGEGLAGSAGSLLWACQAAYRKHVMDDDSIGWDELGNYLLDAICNALGDDGYEKWKASVKAARALGRGEGKP